MYIYIMAALSHIWLKEEWSILPVVFGEEDQ